MKIKEILLEFLLTFVIVFIVSALVTFLYAVIVHGDPAVNWQTAIQMAVIFGVVVPWLNRRGKSD